MEPARGCDAIYTALNTGVDKNRMMDGVLAQLAQQLATVNPDAIALAARYPGIFTDAATAARPVLASRSARLLDAYRPRTIAVCREVFLPAEANEVAAFYRSPLGHRILSLVSANYDAKVTIARGLKNGNETPAIVDADLSSMSRQALSTLSQNDVAEIDRLAQTRPAFRKLPVFRERVVALRVEMENEPMTAEEDAELNRTVTNALRARIESGK
jgi:hypothetical protein